jgi:hypothetical protein
MNISTKLIFFLRFLVLYGARVLVLKVQETTLKTACSLGGFYLVFPLTIVKKNQYQKRGKGNG